MYQLFFKRILDLIFSTVGIILLIPVFIGIAIGIKYDSKGPIFFSQVRIGQYKKPFNLLKFRSMHINTKKTELQVTSLNDSRITSFGKFIRKYKLDELPQLLNVVKGQMSLVGPRPEVQKYINYYPKDYEIILSIKPGITDTAAILFRNEEKILSQYTNIEKAYIEEILPQKIKLYIEYIHNVTLLSDTCILFRTLFSINQKE